MTFCKHCWHFPAVAFLGAIISTSAVAQTVTTRLVNPGAATTSTKILPGGAASMDVRLDIANAAIFGTGFRLTQISPLGSGFISITGRSFAGSPFTDSSSGTADGTVLAPASALLDPDNNDNLGRTTINLVGIPPANNVLAVNLTLTASAATPLGTYTIRPASAVSFATDTSFNDYSMSGGTPFTLIVGQTLTVTKSGAGTGTVVADSGAHQLRRDLLGRLSRQRPSRSLPRPTSVPRLQAGPAVAARERGPVWSRSMRPERSTRSSAEEEGQRFH